MKFSLLLALVAAFLLASCAEEPPPPPARHRPANYPPAQTGEYPPPQQPFNPNGPVQPTGTPPAETAATSTPPTPAPTKKIAKRDYPYGIPVPGKRSEEHTSELQSRLHLVCRLLLEKKKTITLVCSPPSATVIIR